MFLTGADIANQIGSMSSEQGAALGIGLVLIALIFLIILQTISFLLTMLVYNHVAPKENAALRVLITGVIFFILHIIVNFIVSKTSSNPNMQSITWQTVFISLVDSIIGVFIAKICTERFKGSMLTKSFKGALIYIAVSIVFFVIMGIIFGGALLGYIMPEVARAIPQS